VHRLPPAGKELRHWRGDARFAYGAHGEIGCAQSQYVAGNHGPIVVGVRYRQISRTTY